MLWDVNWESLANSPLFIGWEMSTTGFCPNIFLIYTFSGSFWGLTVDCWGCWEKMLIPGFAAKVTLLLFVWPKIMLLGWVLEGTFTGLVVVVLFFPNISISCGFFYWFYFLSFWTDTWFESWELTGNIFIYEDWTELLWLAFDMFYICLRCDYEASFTRWLIDISFLWLWNNPCEDEPCEDILICA